MGQGRRRVFIAIGLLVLAAFVFQALRPERVPVETAPVRRQALEVTVEEQGRTRARERFVVAAPITGRLLRTGVEEGHRVSAGDVLAMMLPPPVDPRELASLRAELAVAEAREKEAEATLGEARSANARAKREAERRRELFERGAVSTETLERYEQAARAASAHLGAVRASVRAAQAEIERVAARLSESGAGAEGSGREEPVRAPASGTVLSVFEESERVVPAGTPLFELSDSAGLEIVADLVTEQAVRVSSGDRVRITGWGGGVELEGTVRHVEPKGFTELSALGVEEQRVNVIIDLADPPPSLGAEFRVEVAIVVWRSEDVLTIPTSALFRRGPGWSSFVVRDGAARLARVEIGACGAERAELLGGAEAGEEVVVFPSDRVEDGVAVEAVPAEEFDTSAP